MDRWEALSDLVHSTASDMASNANNEGESGQVDFLLMNGWDRDEIESRLTQMVTEDATEQTSMGSEWDKHLGRDEPYRKGDRCRQINRDEVEHYDCDMYADGVVTSARDGKIVRRSIKA